MPSSTYPAFVDNSTVCAPLTNDRAELLCYEVFRTYHHFADSANLPAWHSVEEKRKVELKAMIKEGLGMALSGKNFDMLEQQIVNPYITEWRLLWWACRLAVNCLRAQGFVPPLTRED